MRLHPFFLPTVLFGIFTAISAHLNAEQPAQADYRLAIRKLEDFVRHQICVQKLHGLAVALVDDQETVYVAGFGEAKKDSIFRAGSISKLFNAVAVMQLVEQGRIDLDAPIQRYGRRFSIIVPFSQAAPITLRDILCHRSGMTRESPVGGYLDDSEPTMTAAVESVRSCVLLNPPNVKTRYSNIAPTVAGEILAAVAETEYETYQRNHVLGPLGMNHSAFLLKNISRDRLLQGHMRIADWQGGFHDSPAPLFDLGTVPAGNLFTTAGDLAKFVSMLAAEGSAGGNKIIAPATLRDMAAPQLTKENAGFGLGFLVGKFGNHKSLGHMGAVYGYTSSLVFLPDSKLGVVVLCNDDIATGPVAKISNAALAWMLEAKFGETPPPAPEPIALSPHQIDAWTGEYESQSRWAKIDAIDGRLVGSLSGQPMSLTPVGPMKCLANGWLFNDVEVVLQQDKSGEIAGFTMSGERFGRVDDGDKSEIPPLWKNFAGFYGPKYIPLIVKVVHGHLYALIENEFEYRLIPLDRNIFIFPPGMYAEEHLVFFTEHRGETPAANLANQYLRRWSEKGEKDEGR